MKRFLALSMLLFVCVSAVFAVHPLIGKWKFSEVIGGVRFYDYLTITAVNTTTKKVSANITGLSSWKFTGYYNGNIVFIVDTKTDYYMDGYYFTFQGTPSFKKHLGINSFIYDFESAWHSLTATKLSSSTAPTASYEIMTLSDVVNQKALKKEAQLREAMTIPTLLE